MPTYNIVNSITGEEHEEYFTSYSEFQAYLSEHLELTQGVPTSVNIVSGTGSKFKTDAEFNSILKRIKKENPKGKINVV